MSALALATLQRGAFLGMVTEKQRDDQTKDAWRQYMITKCPTFMYWDTKHGHFGSDICTSPQGTQFPPIPRVMKVLILSFFALYVQNYANWIPVHIRGSSGSNMKNIVNGLFPRQQTYSQSHRLTKLMSRITIW